MFLPIKSMGSVIIVFAALGMGAANGKSLSSPLNIDRIREIENIISDYLRNNPEIVMEALEVLRNREKHNKKLQERNIIRMSRDKLFYDNSSPVIGNQNGDIAIVEFFDYRCGYCKKVFSLIPTLLKQDRNVQFIFKELPILSPESEMAARAALVVWKINKQKYFQFHKALMEDRSRLSSPTIMRIAKKLGIDVTQIQEEMGSEEIDKMLLRNQELAKNLGIRGTPAFIIGDKIIPGAVDLFYIKKLISEIRNND